MARLPSLLGPDIDDECIIDATVCLMSFLKLNQLRASAKQLKREKRMLPLVNFAQKAWQFKKNAIDYVNAKQVVAELRGLPADLSLEQNVDLVLSGLKGFLRPIQNRIELVTFMRKVEALKPATILEIGTAKGGTLYLFSKVARKDARIISCDLPGGLYGGGYPAWKGGVFREIIRSPQSLHLQRGNSHEMETKRKVADALNGRQVDVLLIDGDHSYAGVKHDFMLYRDLVRPGGLIAFHDILPNRFDPDIDVARFWNELKAQYSTEDIIDNRQQGQFGIGLVYVPDGW